MTWERQDEEERVKCVRGWRSKKESDMGEAG